jgi:hypothetical protein
MLLPTAAPYTSVASHALLSRMGWRRRASFPLGLALPVPNWELNPKRLNPIPIG